MKQYILTLVLLVITSVAMAQKTCVIASAEDHIPIKEAIIHTDNNHWARTDYRGYFNMKYAFDSATVSKPGFLKTTIYLESLPDTVFLLPESHQIADVEVWGKNQEHIDKMEDNIKKNLQDYLPNLPGGVVMDLTGWMDRRGVRDRKHLKKAKTLMKEYEKKDPIISAYERATGQKVKTETQRDDELESKVEKVE